MNSNSPTLFSPLQALRLQKCATILGLCRSGEQTHGLLYSRQTLYQLSYPPSGILQTEDQIASPCPLHSPNPKSNPRSHRQAPTFTNILLPWALGSERVGVQYTDMDFRSRENSRVNSFRMSCLMTCRVQGGQGAKDRAGNPGLLLTGYLGRLVFPVVYSLTLAFNTPTFLAQNGYISQLEAWMHIQPFLLSAPQIHPARCPRSSILP